jgi:Sap, sulfolipid-1-addressing protein
MEQALGSLLPIGVAAALSSVPIMATILILLSDNRNRSALPFLVGWVLGAVILVSMGTIAANSIPQPRPRQSDTTVGILEVLLGAALVVFSLRTMFGASASVGGSASKWAAAVGAFGAGKSLGLGLALNIRPKGLILSAAASLALRTAKLDLEETALLVVVYSAIATSTVTIPIVATLVSPQRMEPRLINGRDWLDEHGYVVTATVMLLIGVIIVGAGIGKF